LARAPFGAPTAHGSHSLPRCADCIARGWSCKTRRAALPFRSARTLRARLCTRFACRPFRRHFGGSRRFFDILHPRFTMKTLVSVPHHDYPASARDSVEAKLQNLSKYFERIESLRAVLAREHDSHRVELVAHVGNGATLVVDAQATVSLDAAVDAALARMKGVLSRHKDRLVRRNRRPKRS
jgi:ribosomal subunit interface protein